MHKALAAVVATCCVLLSHTVPAAENYPTHALTMIVPFPAGGATDTLARYLGERMRPILGQSIIIENVAGAAGTIRVTRAVRAPRRRLYALHRNIDHAHADRRPLCAAVRSAG